MKKIFLFGMMLLVFAASQLAAEMTADDLIAKYLAASGGEAKFRAVKTVMMKGSMFTQGMTPEVKMMVMPPEKGYMEISMNNMVMQAVGTNGKEAWMKSPMGTYALGGDQMKSAKQQSDLFPLLDYKKRGGKVKYLGEDLVKGAKAYKLEFVGSDGDTVTYSFDATSFYPIKEKRKEGTMMMSDHKKAGDLILPYKISAQTVQGQMMISFDTIAVNGTIPDSIFVMPKDAKPYEELMKMMQGMQQQMKSDTTGGKK